MSAPCGESNGLFLTLFACTCTYKIIGPWKSRLVYRTAGLELQREVQSGTEDVGRFHKVNGGPAFHETIFFSGSPTFHESPVVTIANGVLANTEANDEATTVSSEPLLARDESVSDEEEVCIYVCMKYRE